MSELRNRGPDRGQEQSGTQGPPDTTHRRLPENPKTGAERLRMLYGSQPPVAPHGDAPAPQTHKTAAERLRILYGSQPRLPPQGDASAPSGSAGNRGSGAPYGGRDHEDGSDPGGPYSRDAAHRSNARQAPDTSASDDIDPRLLAGVPRPRGALPDDTGRAYLASTREPHVAADHDGKNDTSGAADTDHGDRRDPPQEGDREARLHAWVDRPTFKDPHGDPPPDRYGDPLTLSDGSRVPRFNGRPVREQTHQGDLHDCGIMATLGAVASHRPGDIAHRVAIQADGSYRVRLDEARFTKHGAAPTGRVVELFVTPDLPVYDDEHGRPAFAQAEGGAAWSPVLEKAVAGVDQTWTASRRGEWAESWAELCELDAADKEVENPRTGPPPDGYVRLNQGSSAWDRAELLTQLTGEESVVRSIPRRADGVTSVLDRQLGEGKPVLAASRSEAYKGEELPHELVASHAYEVVAVREGKVVLRNPWNHTHPEPMTPAEFAANMEPKYTTVK